MFGLVLGAVRARGAQVLTLLVLSLLATLVAAAGPWFAVAAMTKAAASDVAAAPAGQRTLSVRQATATNGDPESTLDDFAASVGATLTVGGKAPVLGLRQTVSLAEPDVAQSVAMSYRDGLCRHVALSGTCPAATGDVILSVRSAQALGLTTGDRLVLQSAPGVPPISLRVTGTYELSDPAGAYWSDALYRADAGIDPLFTPMTTFTLPQLGSPTLTYDVEVSAAQLRGDGDQQLGRTLAVAAARLNLDQREVVDATPPLLAMIAHDRSTIRQGVLVALGEVLVLGWFAIGLAARYTGRERRGDAALLKLRGSTRSGMLRLAVGQHLVPLAGGVILGAPLGFLLARWLAGPVTGAAQQSEALGLSVPAVGAVLAGGLVVLVLVEAAVLGLPVAMLLRRVSAAHRDWRATVVDLVLVAVAAAAVYQARSGGSDNSLGLLAPVLVELAVALVLARLLVRVAGRAGAVSIRRGRLGAGLTAVQVSRQPGTDRVFALIVVAVAMLATAAGGWSAGRQARIDRSTVQWGATRVLSVRAANRTELENAVRRADPGGRSAMAAVVDRSSDPPVLAVDSSRLAAVARWRPEYGPVGTLAAATGAAPRPAPRPPVTGSRLVLEVTSAGQGPVDVIAVLQSEAGGAIVRTVFGPISRGRHTVAAPLPGCGEASGCRLVRFELVSSPPPGGKPGAMPPDTDITIRRLTQQQPAGTVLGADTLGDIARWRSGDDGPGLALTAARGVLELTAVADPLGQSPPGNQVYAVDSALPVPIVLAGPPPSSWQTADATVIAFGGIPNAVRVVGTARVLPALGPHGMLVDLDTARRVAGGADLGGDYQVWLAPDAPASVRPALQRAGLTVTGDDSVTATAADLDSRGSAVAARFAVLAGFIALLLAAAAVAVTAAVDRRPQADQLRSLRTQGLSRRAAVLVAYAGPVSLIIAGLIGGVLAAVLAGPVARVTAPGFTDGWAVIALPGPLGPPALTVAALVAAMVLGATGWLSARPLARRLRGGAR